MTIAIHIALWQEGKLIEYPLEIEEGSNARQAFAQLCQQQGLNPADWHHKPVGIFNRLTTWDAPLTAGSRLEIYDPVQIDPKEARRLRALRAKKQGARAAAVLPSAHQG